MITVQGNVIERRASHVLVSDNPDGPYVPMKDSTYLPADKPTLDGTFWVDKGSPDKPGGLSIQLCKSEKKEFYIRYSS